MRVFLCLTNNVKTAIKATPESATGKHTNQPCHFGGAFLLEKENVKTDQLGHTMKQAVRFGGIDLVNADALEHIKTLPDNCIDLIATDPPYYRVKNHVWDRQWNQAEDYLNWLDAMFAEFWRVLKPAGSLYCFCGCHLASDIELLMRKRFKVLNHIIWTKPSGRWNKTDKQRLRTFFQATDRVLFAEHYQNPRRPDNNGSVKQVAMQPLIDYFRNARRSLGISEGEIDAATGKQMASHWFSYSQWQLPSETDYLKLQSLFNQIAAKKQQRSELSRPHHQLVTEYQSLRRYFSVSADVHFTDIWTYPSVHYYPGKHPCEKPAAMMEHIITSSSRPGDLVADFFMGSGSTVKAALKLGRRALGVELESERFNQTVEEIKHLAGEVQCQSLQAP